MATTQRQSSQLELPYLVKRIIGRYEPAFRARLKHYLMVRRAEGSAITWNELNEAISQVFSELSERRTPRFDPAIEREAMEQYKRGDFLTTQEWIDEIAGRMAPSNS